MKSSLVLPVAILGFSLVCITGCHHDDKPAEPATAAAMDLKPIEPAAQPPVVVQPAPTDANASAGSKASLFSKKYTVAKGDTLYSIAKRRYGSGSAANISKIEKANPNLKPETLKVGQTIMLP